MPTILTCALIAQNVYESRPSTIIGYNPIYCSPGDPTGFFGVAYQGQVGVIAFRGSQEKEDWTDADVDIARDRLPSSQIGDAFSFFTKAREMLLKNGCKRFVVVGHSLGGGLAALVASNTKAHPTRGLTFNAPGMKGISRFGNVVDPELDKAIAKTAMIVGVATLSPLLGLATGAALKAYSMSLAGGGATLNLPGKNIDEVYNVRSAADVVSRAKGNYIGKPPYVIRSAGLHQMGPLIDALREHPVGAFHV